MRYIRRWCMPSNRPTGELHTPPSIKEGIATRIACKVFDLDMDAEHLQCLVANNFSPHFLITDEDVALIWCHYEGTLQDTPFVDAVIWFILEQVMDDLHALAQEMRCMLMQEEYEDLKARVRFELEKTEWRGERRTAFLQRYTTEREARVTSGGAEDSSREKLLPGLPVSSRG